MMAAVHDGGGQGLQRFRGIVASRHNQTGLFWNRLDVTDTELVLGTKLGGERRLARSAVGEVVFDPVYLVPFYWQTRVRFVMADGQRWPEWFVTLRPGPVRAALEEAGWPVVVLETIGYRRFTRRLVGGRSPLGR